MQEQIVARQLAEQEHKKAQQEEAAAQYMDNVYNTLSHGKLGDIKLDRKVLAELAYNNPEVFKSVVKKVQSSLA